MDLARGINVRFEHSKSITADSLIAKSMTDDCSKANYIQPCSLDAPGEQGPVDFSLFRVAFGPIFMIFAALETGLKSDDFSR